MITKKAMFWLWVCGLMILTGYIYADIPHMMNYQGVIVVNGARFDGTGYFKFAIVNAAGDVTYWSNDGTSVTGDEPTSAVSLSVSEGRFSVQLGDTGIPNMTQEIPPDVFISPERYLRIWFDDGVNGSQLLSPDSRLKSTPYSYIADDAQQLDGQDSTDFASALHTHSSLNAADGSPADAVYVDNDGNVGIGSTIPSGRLEVAGNTTITGALAANGGITFDAVTDVIAGIQNQNLVDKTASENISGTWEMQDNTALQFGTDGDVLVQYDEATDDRLEISGTNADVWLEDNLTVAGNVTVGASTIYSDGAIDTSDASPFSIGATNATALTIGRDGQNVMFPGSVDVSAYSSGERLIVENPSQTASNNSSPRIVLKAYNSGDTQQTMGLQLRTSAPGTRLSFISGSGGAQRGYIDSNGNLQTNGDLDINGTGTSDFAGNVTVNGTIDANGAITGDGGAAISGMLYTVVSDTDGKTVTVAEAQSVQTNAGASASGVWNLPECSTAVGAVFTFVVTAAQNLNINPDSADQILGLTDAVGDSIQSSTIGDTITLLIVDNSNVVVLSSYGTWTDAN